MSMLQKQTTLSEFQEANAQVHSFFKQKYMNVERKSFPFTSYYQMEYVVSASGLHCRIFCLMGYFKAMERNAKSMKCFHNLTEEGFNLFIVRLYVGRVVHRKK